MHNIPTLILTQAVMLYLSSRLRESLLYLKEHMDEKLPMLDLFSGIGGFSYAFKSIFHTIAYCEIDPNCRNVIKHNINLGRIPQAPIFEDVRSLDPNDLSHSPAMITAGFPCQDVSAANTNSLGIEGARSALIGDVFRLIDSIPTLRYVFLENSPRIMGLGGEDIVERLSDRGFLVAWITRSAADVGAPHLRMRWFCLAFRDLKMPPSKLFKTSWTNEPCPRVIPAQSGTHKTAYRLRCEMLGNAVVPLCVQTAYNDVVDVVTKHIPQTTNLRVHDKLLYLLSHKGLLLFPVKGSSPGGGKLLKLEDGQKCFQLNRWGTPTVSVQYLYRTLTARASRMLVSQIYYERDTQKYMRKSTKGLLAPNEADKLWNINPQFIEWLMGFPPDWTKWT